MAEDLLIIGRWLIQFVKQLWNFLGTAHFLGFAFIGMFVLRKICSALKSLLSNN